MLINPENGEFRPELVKRTLLSSPETNPERIVLSGLVELDELLSGGFELQIRSSIDLESMSNLERYAGPNKESLASDIFPIVKISENGLVFKQGGYHLLNLDSAGFVFFKDNLIKNGALVRRNVNEGKIQTSKPPYFFETTFELPGFARGANGTKIKAELKSGVNIGLSDFDQMWSMIIEMIKKDELTIQRVRGLANPYFKFELKTEDNSNNL